MSKQRRGVVPSTLSLYTVLPTFRTKIELLPLHLCQTKQKNFSSSFLSINYGSVALNRRLPPLPMLYNKRYALSLFSTENFPKVLGKNSSPIFFWVSFDLWMESSPDSGICLVVGFCPMYFLPTFSCTRQGGLEGFDYGYKVW